MKINTPPSEAMVLCAGLGTRMRPLTYHTPKPLLQIGGTPMLDMILKQLKAAHVDHCVINTHHLADHFVTYEGSGAVKVTLSHEEEILETGGGLVQALPLFKTAPFYAVNGDAVWTDGPTGNVFKRLAQQWNDDAMDILMLVQSVSAMRLTQGVGDYVVDKDGRAHRKDDKSGSHMFTGIRLHHPRIFDNAPKGRFSYLDLMDKAESKGRLFALIHDGEWHHISTPEDLRTLNRYLSGSEF